MLRGALTLLALVAFDVGAVTTMRRYLLTQTDSNLQGALTLTLPRLAATLALQPGRPGRRPRQPGEVMRPPPVTGAGHGQVTLQVAASGSTGGHGVLSPTAAKVAARPGPHTLIGPHGRNLIRVQSLRVAGGSLVAGTSLDQVAKTIDKVEFIVTSGSIAVVLLIGLGVFVVLRRGLRPIEAMAGQADRITAGDLTDRVDPAQPAQRGRQARRGAERHAGPDRDRPARARGQPGADAPVLRRRQPRAAHAAGLAARQRRALPAGRAAQHATRSTR